MTSALFEGHSQSLTFRNVRSLRGVYAIREQQMWFLANGSVTVNKFQLLLNKMLYLRLKR